MLNKKISIVASFRNEEKNLEIFSRRIHESFQLYKNLDYEIIFINDDSTDKSEDIILNLKKHNINFKLVNIKPWAGHTPSNLLGIDLTEKGNYLTVIDCDLQDPPELIAQNLDKMDDFDIIHFIREERDDGFFQKIYTYIAYLILALISFGKIERNAGYFKIISPNIVEKLKKNNLRYPYMNYFFSKYAKKPKRIIYSRKKRLFGKSKFNIFSLNPWMTFYGGVYYFTFNYIVISVIMLLVSINILNYFNQHNYIKLLTYVSVIFIFFQVINLIITIINYIFNLIIKKKKVSYKII